MLWRAVVFAAPAGAAIWLSANLRFNGVSVAEHLARALDPVGTVMGLNGVILLAYLIAIPANEIVLPTVLMLIVLMGGPAETRQAAGVIFEAEDTTHLRALLESGGWSMLTAVNLMLFNLCHNPCSTTLYTLYRETKSARWTLLAALIPLVLGVGITILVAFLVRLATG